MHAHTYFTTIHDDEIEKQQWVFPREVFLIKYLFWDELSFDEWVE